MTDRAVEIAKEARRQEESCLYTSTTHYEWLRQVRRQNTIFIVAPIILGALAGFSVLKDVGPAWLVALLAFLASLFPALANALKIQTSVNEIAASAANYKSLQDRFRQLATIGVLGDVDAAEAQLGELMDRMDVARSTSITAPEKYFKRAQDKIAEGHYNFAVDEGPKQVEDGTAAR
jgi:hypothetical protein